MNAEILTESDLKAISQTGTRPALRKWLDERGIRYEVGRDGLITSTRTWYVRRGLDAENDPDLEFEPAQRQHG